VIKGNGRMFSSKLINVANSGKGGEKNQAKSGAVKESKKAEESHRRMETAGSTAWTLSRTAKRPWGRNSGEKISFL